MSNKSIHSFAAYIAASLAIASFDTVMNIFKRNFKDRKMLIKIVVTFVCFLFLSLQCYKLYEKNNVDLEKSAHFLNYSNYIAYKNPLFISTFKSDPVTHIHSRFLKYLASLVVADKLYPGAQTYIDYSIIRLGLKPLLHVNPLRPDFGLVFNDVTAFNYPIGIDKCRQEIKSNNRTLFIGILSAPNYFEKRQLIRQTWLRHLTDPLYHRGLFETIGYGFILGQTSDNLLQIKIQDESVKYGDILQIEMVDSYYSLTRKVVGLLNWVNNNCPRVAFVLKFDDDGYINVHNLATTLASLAPTEASIYGKQVGNHGLSREHRNSKHKLYKSY